MRERSSIWIRVKWIKNRPSKNKAKAKSLAHSSTSSLIKIWDRIKFLISLKNLKIWDKFRPRKLKIKNMPGFMTRMERKKSRKSRKEWVERTSLKMKKSALSKKKISRVVFLLILEAKFKRNQNAHLFKNGNFSKEVTESVTFNDGQNTSSRKQIKSDKTIEAERYS